MQHVTWGRTHFIEYVRAGGPLPALRIGRQPYGILPVSSLTRWQASPHDAHETGLVKLLQEPVLSTGSNSVSRTTSRVWDAQRIRVQDLQEVLHTDALSAGYRVRNVYGNSYIRILCGVDR